MATFAYKALAPGGAKAKGTIAAESAGAARKLLRNRQLHVTDLKSVSDLGGRGGFDIRHMMAGRRRREVLEFTRQLGTMIESGVKLTEAMSVLITQSDNPEFRQIIQNIQDQVVGGETLADGFKEYPLWFDPIYVSMVRVGEMTGNVGRSFKLLADHINKRQQLEAKVKSALMYPAILIVVSILATIVLMTFVVPKLAGIIVKSGRELPPATQILMAISGGLVRWWWLLIILFFVCTWLYRRIGATPRGRLVIDQFLLKLPVFGTLLRETVVSRFASTLAVLIRSGLPMADSLQVVAGVTGNAVMDRAVHAARERIIAGADVSTPLRESRVVSSAVAHMISVGERTGELESMLLMIAQSIEERTDITIQRLSSTIEPLVLLVMGTVVGFIIYAILVPMLEVANLAQR